jgi:hypothetical protein
LFAENMFAYGSQPDELKDDSSGDTLLIFLFGPVFWGLSPGFICELHQSTDLKHLLSCLILGGNNY